MRASHAPSNPQAPGIWLSIPAASRMYGVPANTLRGWVNRDRLRTKEREGVKGVLVWSEEVISLARMQQDTQGGRLPKTA